MGVGVTDSEDGMDVELGNMGGVIEECGKGNVTTGRGNGGTIPGGGGNGAPNVRL